MMLKSFTSFAPDDMTHIVWQGTLRVNYSYLFSFVYTN